MKKFSVGPRGRPIGLALVFLAVSGAMVLGAPALAQTQTAVADAPTPNAPAHEPMTVGVIGLSHDHVGNVFNSNSRGDIRIVGIVEPNRDLARRYVEKYGLSMDLVYDDMKTMLDKTHPIAVTGFGPIADHLHIVEIAAPRGINVMVEKPLALTFKQAKTMARLASVNHIHLLTNYETTWYPTGVEAKSLLDKGNFGPVRKMVFHDGHAGPAKIGVSKEFFAWLTDPKQNGGGAIIDFGCYGADLMTWLTKGETPLSVTAVTRHFQRATYPRVDDDATVIVDYRHAQGIIEASWDWPVGRKDMELYATNGQIIADDKYHLRTQGSNDATSQTQTLADRPHPYDDPFIYFTAVVSGDVVPEPYDPSSVETNLLVMKILDAARESAKTGKTVKVGD